MEYQTPSPQVEPPAPTLAGPEVGEGAGVGMSEEGARSRDHVDGVEIGDRVDAAAFATALDDDTLTSDQLVAMASRLARFSFAEATTVWGDDALMLKLALRVDVDQMAMVLLYFRVPLVKAVTWAHLCGLTLDAFSRLVSGKTAEQCLEVVQTPATWAPVRALPVSDPVNIFPLLALDPAKFLVGLTSNPDWIAWIIEKCGVERLSEVFERIAEFQADQTMREQLQWLGMYDIYVTLHPAPTTDDREARRLYNWALTATTAEEGVRLFRARFDWRLDDQAAVADDAATADEDESKEEAHWDLASILRCWQICGRLPPDQVLTGISVIRESQKAGSAASGWAAGDDEMGMSWGTDVMADRNEVGAFADDQDTMRGMNMFDATFRHEIGHTVGVRGGFDGPGGFVQTVFDFKQHEFTTLVDELAALMPLSDELSEDEKDATLEGLKSKDHKFTEAAFKTGIIMNGVLAGAGTLWFDVEDEPLVQYLIERAEDGSWNRPNDVGGRSYHVDYTPNGDFVSYPSAMWGKKVSAYAMRSPAEWFAECYATFYAEADMPEAPVGRLLSQRDPAAYGAFVTMVHGMFNFGTMTGQQMGHGTMGV